MNADDRRLIDECLSGNRSAFGELVRRYQDRLYNTVYRFVDGNAEDARDVVQDTFMHAFQALDSFKGDAQFFTWLHRIAFNAAVSLKRKRKPLLSLEASVSGESGLDPLDESEGNQPSDAMERAEDERVLQEALKKLSPEHRAVLVLKDLEDQKYEAIAEILDVPIGTIRSRLHRARLELRALLVADGE